MTDYFNAIVLNYKNELNYPAFSFIPFHYILIIDMFDIIFGETGELTGEPGVMNSFKDYADKDQLISLCRDIEMPDEATEYICGPALHADFTDIERYFDSLFSFDIVTEAWQAIHDWGNAGNGLLSLTAYLIAALKSKEMYYERGIDESFYIDSMKIFSRFTNEYKKAYGQLGYNRGNWPYRQIGLNIFRPGCLEFEIIRVNEDLMKRLGIGKPEALAVHIPSDSLMTRQALDESYAAANTFFPRFFPTFKPQCTYCHTWLLAPALKEILPADSRIITFQSDYDIVDTEEESTGFIRWVFKKEFEDYENIP